MPVYDYACPRCGPFEALRGMAHYDQPAPCPQCNTDSPRALISAPGLALMPTQRRRAIGLNEQSAHAPIHSRNYDHDAHRHHTHTHHPKGCGCCSGSTHAALTQVAANGNKSFPSKRPWMLSH